MPQVGCGLGGLSWEQVRPLIEEHLGPIAQEVLVYVRSGPVEVCEVKPEKSSQLPLFPSTGCQSEQAAQKTITPE